MADTLSFGLEKHQIRMNKKNFNNLISIVTGETGRVLEIQLLDNNENVQNTTGISLRLNALVKGKATYTDAVLLDATTGTYRLDLSNGMFLATGTWEFQWQITDSNGKRIYSIVFEGTVGKNIAEGGSQASNFYLNFAELNSMHKEFLNERSLLGERLDGNNTTLDDHEGRIVELENDLVVTATNISPVKAPPLIVSESLTTSRIYTANIKSGHMYYISLETNSTVITNTSTNLYFDAIQGIGNLPAVVGKVKSSYTAKATADYSGVRVYPRTPVGETLAIDYLLILNLTETFGAGNEPTKEQMDRLLAQFPNSWFDGTENLFLAKWALDELRRLDNEKANKKQEEWITPTLMSGATSTEGYPVGYMKDDMGVVHFRGKLIVPSYGVATIALPVGYRPANHSDFVCSVKRDKVGRIFIQSTGIMYPSFPYDANSEYDLSGISFRV